MSDSNPYRLLGLTEDAPFEEVQEARARMLTEFAADDKQQQMVEIAYDNILMQRLKMRQDGKIKVPERIRYPERAVLLRPTQQQTSRPAQQWWRRLPINLSEAGVSGLIFGAIWLLYFALASTPQTDTSYAVVIGLLTTLYFLYRKTQVFWKAILYTLGALVLAEVVASSLQNLDVTHAYTGPIGIVLFVIFWLATILLR
jgi:membrane-bound ClpP family serine protease